MCVDILDFCIVLTRFLFRKFEDIRQRMITIIKGDPGVSQSCLFQSPVVSQALRQAQTLDEDSFFTLEGYIPPPPPKRKPTYFLCHNLSDLLPSSKAIVSEEDCE